MTFNSMFYVWLFFLLANDPIVWLGFDEHRSTRKRYSGKQSSYFRALLSKYITYASIIVFVFSSGYYGAQQIPKLVNKDFEVEKVQVEEVKVAEASGKIWNYESIEVRCGKQKKYIEWIWSPKLKKGDDITIYYDEWINFVSEINGKDVTGIYRWKPALLGESTVKARLFLTGYLIVFLIWQCVIYRKNRKDYRICQNKPNQFICGYDAETYGYKVWRTGLVLYTIVVILTIAGIGSTGWLGIAMMLFMYLYNLGYWLVFVGKSRSVIYNSNEILIKETSGYIRKYAIEDINYISEVKLNKYRIVFKDDFAQYIGIRNEYQKNVLKDLAGGTFEKDIYYD